MIKLYGHELSGNTYKAKLLLSLLDIKYEFVRIDLMKGEHKQEEFLAINPFGQVPTLVDNDIVVSDAQAILTYLARQYGNEDWLPMEPESLSKIVRWLSTTAGEVRQGLENARLYHLFGATSINIERAEEKSHFILNLLNQHLQGRNWLEFERPTIADIAVFPYIALARDGKISLDSYPNVLAWLDQVKNLSGFVAMLGI